MMGDKGGKNYKDKDQKQKQQNRRTIRSYNNENDVYCMSCFFKWRG
jgi:hypothetical protein